MTLNFLKKQLPLVSGMVAEIQHSTRFYLEFAVKMAVLVAVAVKPDTSVAAVPVQLRTNGNRN